jgi:hypothetical protein
VEWWVVAAQQTINPPRRVFQSRRMKIHAQVPK